MSNLIRLIGRRLVALPVMVLGVTLLVFVVMSFSSADPARLALGASSWTEQLVALAIALVFLPLLVHVAAAIYTRAVTRTGARVPLKEVLRRAERS